MVPQITANNGRTGCSTGPCPGGVLLEWQSSRMGWHPVYRIRHTSSSIWQLYWQHRQQQEAGTWHGSWTPKQVGLSSLVVAVVVGGIVDQPRHVLQGWQSSRVCLRLPCKSGILCSTCGSICSAHQTGGMNGQHHNRLAPNCQAVALLQTISLVYVRGGRDEVIIAHKGRPRK